MVDCNERHDKVLYSNMATPGWWIHFDKQSRDHPGKNGVTGMSNNTFTLKLQVYACRRALQ